MTSAKDGRKYRLRRLVAQLGVPALVASLTTNVIGEVLGSGLFGQWGWYSTLIVALGCAVLMALSYWREGDLNSDADAAPGQTMPENSLPPQVDVLGRADVTRAVVREAHRAGMVVVYGPSGVGTSAVAIEAARLLVPDPSRQHYADLRGQDPGRVDSPRRIAIRLLTMLGVPAGRVRDLPAAREAIRKKLREGQHVLLLDNVSTARQLSWLAHHLSGAYVIAAGDITERELISSVPHVPVGVLDRQTALLLLGRQPGADQRGRRLVDRLAAEKSATQELADHYLKHPGVVIEVGAWLLANPSISMSQLLDALRQHCTESSSIVRYIRAQQVAGVSAGARRLMGLLARAPVSQLSEQAIAVLASVPTEKLAGLLDELVGRLLIERIRPARYQIPRESRGFRDCVGDGEADNAVVRLVVFFAEFSVLHADSLNAEAQAKDLTDAQVWFRDEDTALLGLLRMANPPSRAADSLWRIADGLDAWFTWENRFTDRRVTAEAAVEAARLLHDNAAQQTGFLRLSALARLAGDMDVATAHLQQARALSTKSMPGLSRIHTSEGLYLMATGDFAAAEQHFRMSRALRSRRDNDGRVLDLTNLGAVMLQQERLGVAYATLSEACDLAENVGDSPGLAHALELLGVLSWRRGNPQAALEKWAESQLRYEQGNDDLGQARCLLHQGSALLASSDGGSSERRTARTMLLSSLELLGSHHGGLARVLVHINLAEDDVRLGHLDSAEQHCIEALTALKPLQEATHPNIAVAHQRLKLISPLLRAEATG